MITDTEANRHEQRIGAVLERKRAEQIAKGESYELGDTVTTYTPLSALLRSEEEDADEDRMRSEIIGRFIDFVMQDGMHPMRAMKNFYAAVHALRPQAMPGEWSCQDLADLFGETKAAHSWRVKQLFGKRLEGRGRLPIKARFQKSSASIANYASAQKGNSNRRHGLAKSGKKAA